MNKISYSKEEKVLVLYDDNDKVIGIYRFDDKLRVPILCTVEDVSFGDLPSLFNKEAKLDKKDITK